MKRTVAICALFIAARASADAEELQPDFFSLQSWASVSTWDYAAILGGNAVTITVAAAVQPSTHWQGGILFDNWARKGLRLSSEAARTHAGTISTVLAVSVGLFPMLVDSGLLTAWIHKRTDLGWQMLIVDVEALTLMGVVTTVTSHTVGRERPSGMNENDSFFSGHEGVTSSAATLICLQHLQLGLLGNRAADGTVCGIGIAAAVTTGFLRIMADRHYATDVVVGAAVGVSSAFLVYSLKAKPRRPDEISWQLVPMMRSDFLGLSLAGDF